MSDLILASGSPRRSLLMSAAGYTFTVSTPDVDEAQLSGEDPASMVLRLSDAKSRTVSAPVGTTVLAADTVVVLDGAVLGKPKDAADAVAMLTSLCGRSHSVLTGWTVRDGEAERYGVAESIVHFADHTENDLKSYVERVQPFDKAGGYALQGDDGWLVTSVAGSRANVMGLPLSEIVPALAEFGVERSTPDGG